MNPIVWLSDGRIVTTTLRPQDVQFSSASAPDGVRVLNEIGTIPPSESFDMTLYPCDGCERDWGLRISDLTDGLGAQIHRVLSNQRVLLFDNPSWYGGRDGFYCMGCSMPPR